MHGLSSCNSQAQLPHDTWYLHGPGIKSLSFALQGEFLTAWEASESSSLRRMPASDFRRIIELENHHFMTLNEIIQARVFR